jgi:K+-transporting ATPase ATPase C chain
MVIKQIRSALLVFAVLTVITGIAYPLCVTAVAQIVFPKQANGSLIVNNGTIVGSTLIGQQFAEPKYFFGRLSATSSVPYNAAVSSGSNIGPSNDVLRQNIEARIAMLKNADPKNMQAIPIDLVTSSGSGLDPHISIAAAMYQAARVARLRGISEQDVVALIRVNTEGRFLGVIGEPVVNVLQLNLGLDRHGK